MADASRKGKKGTPDKQPAVAPVNRQEVAKKRRDERMKAYQRNRRQVMITKIVAVALGIALIGGIVYAIVDRSQSTANAKAPDGVKSYTYAGAQHDDAFNGWPEVPPVGGTHNSTWQKCGYYPAPIVTGMGVHDMEHGAVWITYARDLPQDQVDRLKQLAEDQDYVIVSPYDGLPAPVVLSSWNRQLQMQTFDMKTIKQYVTAFKNNPEFTPEFGATCASGSTATM